MSEKRKDNRGRILRSGESQRANGSYQYRYTDIHNTRKYIYAKTLDELRKQEGVIQKDLVDGIDHAAGSITVIELVDKYMSLKRGLKRNSLRAYGTAIKRIRTSEFGQRQIKSVRLSDAKGWLLSLHDGGMKQNTIGVIFSVIHPAFEMAVDDDIIRKNPFKFRLADVVPNDAEQRVAMSKDQQQQYLQYVSDHGQKYYDEVVILLGTGMRVSELYGLTKADIDFENRRIHIRRQLCRTADKSYFVTPPKSGCGVRCIPMTDAVYLAFGRAIAARITPKVELLLDGCSGFIFLDKSGMPKVAMHLQNKLRLLQQKYITPNNPTFPRVTPHVLRHTFCTNMLQAGIDIKSLQYLMGHSYASMTLDVYAHSDYAHVEDSFSKIAANV